MYSKGGAVLIWEDVGSGRLVKDLPACLMCLVLHTQQQDFDCGTCIVNITSISDGLSNSSSLPCLCIFKWSPLKICGWATVECKVIHHVPLVLSYTPPFSLSHRLSLRTSCLCYTPAAVLLSAFTVLPLVFLFGYGWPSRARPPWRIIRGLAQTWSQKVSIISVSLLLIPIKNKTNSGKIQK